MMQIVLKLSEMFLEVIVGIIGTRSLLVPKAFNDNLSKYIMNISLPCSIVIAFTDGVTKEMWIQSGKILIATCVLMVFYLVFNRFSFNTAPSDEKPVYKFAILCPNTNFLCYPMVTALYGNTGILLLSMAHIPYRIFTWIFGIRYFNADSKDPWYKKLLVCLPMWAVIVGIIIAVLNVKIPTPLFNAIDTMGKTNTGLSMYLIGAGIAYAKPSSFKQRRVLIFCAIRLVLIPAIAIAACKLTGLTGAVAGTLIFMTAMPAGTLTVLFTHEYNKNSEVAAAIVTLSMILCAVTLPLLSNICLTYF